MHIITKTEEDLKIPHMVTHHHHFLFLRPEPLSDGKETPQADDQDRILILLLSSPASPEFSIYAHQCTYPK